MKKNIITLALSLFIMLFVPTMALALDNGFYKISFDGSSPLVKTQEQKEVRIGSRENIEINKVHLSSTDNWNEKFHLSVEVPYNKELNSGRWYILIIDDTVFGQTSLGSSQEETSTLGFRISGKKQVETIAKYFSIKPYYRAHPNYFFAVKFIPEKNEFAKDEEIWVIFKIKNIGNNKISFMKGGRNRAPRDNQYSFIGEYGGKQISDIGSSHHFGGIATKCTIKPGEIFEDRINLSKWFDFENSGMHRILGSYFMEFHKPEDDSYAIIWEDYITAEFYIKIK